MTAPAHPQNISNGNFLDDSFLGVVGAVVMSINANITSRVNVILVWPLYRVFFGGRL